MHTSHMGADGRVVSLARSMKTFYEVIIQIFMISHLAGFYRRLPMIIIIDDQNDSIH